MRPLIQGKVDSRWQAWVPLEMLDGSGHIHSVDVVVDTGFSGYLTLPAEIIRRLDLEPDVQTNITLATGVRDRVNTWNGFVLWDDQPLIIQILESAGTPLLGMRLMQDSQLTIQARINGDVIIERLDESST